MKDYHYVPGWRLNKENNKPAIKHSILMLTTHGIAEGEWNGNEWIQYRWSCKVNDSDVLYWMHLEDLTQLEKEGQPLQQEQPTKGYDEKYLNEKIAKAKKSWDGVDVDKYMDDVRGREQPEIDLEKEYKTWWNSISGKINVEHIMEWYMHETARYFYELGRLSNK